MFLLCYHNLSHHKTPEQKPRKPSDFLCSAHGIFLNFKLGKFPQEGNTSWPVANVVNDWNCQNESRFCRGRKTGVAREKHLESDCDQQISAQSHVRSWGFDPVHVQRWEVWMMTTIKAGLPMGKCKNWNTAQQKVMYFLPWPLLKFLYLEPCCHNDLLPAVGEHS